MRWSRNNAFANAPDISIWPDVDRATLHDRERDAFDRRVLAMRLYASGESLKEIRRRTNVNPAELPRLAKRCLTLTTDGLIFGFRGLRHFGHLAPYVRQVEAGYKRREQQGGQAGALGYVLRLFPDIEDSLIGAVRQEAKNLGVPEFKIRPVKLHGLFIRALEEKASKNLYPRSGWPFNCKYLGLRSIQDYMKGLLLDNFGRTVSKRSEVQARAHLNIGNGNNALLVAAEPFDIVEIDAYKIDVQCAAKFRTPKGAETSVVLERLWLIAAVDRASTAVLAWIIVYRTEVSASDILKLLKLVVFERWEKKTLTVPGINYPPGGGFPSGLLDEANGAVWSILLLDGALAHLAIKVREQARKQLGNFMNWGPVGHFERRPNIERTFKKIAEGIFHRMPSTTGSHPHNGRAKDPAAAALKHGIYADHIEELAELFFSEHNILPSSGISYLSPIEFLQHFLCGNTPKCEARKLPVIDQTAMKAILSTERRTIRGSLESGRRPYVQIDSVHYTSPVLADSGALIGMQILVHIDEEDMRQVRASLPDGTDFGVLIAVGQWSRTKHSRTTRQEITSLITRRILLMSQLDDPVEIYLKWLGSVRPKRDMRSSEITAKQATEIVRVAKDSGVIAEVSGPKKEQHEMQKLSEVAARPSLLRNDSPLRRMAKNRR